MNIKSVNKINNDQEITDDFKYNLNIIINNSILRPDAQSKQKLEVMDVNSPKEFMKLPSATKSTRIFI